MSNYHIVKLYLVFNFGNIFWGTFYIIEKVWPLLWSSIEYASFLLPTSSNLDMEKLLSDNSFSKLVKNLSISLKGQD